MMIQNLSAVKDKNPFLVSKKEKYNILYSLSHKLLKRLYPDYHLFPEEYLIFSISILDMRQQNRDQ
jgi:hypothetical protein